MTHPRIYLHTALDIIEREAVCASQVDWIALRAAAEQHLQNAVTTAETYPFIREALAALGDHHSFLRPPQHQGGLYAGGFGLKYIGGVIARVYPGSAADAAGLKVGERVLRVNDLPVSGLLNAELPRTGDVTLVVADARGASRTVPLQRGAMQMNRLPQGRMLQGDVAWLDLPDHDGSGLLPGAQHYPDVAQTLIHDLMAQGARRWVVDLRLNEGGNMHPMLAGIGPLTGEGVLGRFVRDDQSWAWTYHAGVAAIEGNVLCQATVLPAPVQDAPVAVLLSPLTSSSGEIMAISFRGRPDTRFFGEATQGLTSANSAFPLEDGASLYLATCYEADRTGQVYTGPVMPDEVVPTDWATYLSGEDTVLHAALRWLTRPSEGL